MNIIVMCAKCNKPVDEIIKLRDHIKCSTHYIAHCHGDVDRCEVDDIFMANIDLRDRVIAVAFRGKELIKNV